MKNTQISHHRCPSIWHAFRSVIHSSYLERWVSRRPAQSWAYSLYSAWDAFRACCAYQENLTITKPVALVAAGRVVVTPQDTSRSVIDVAGTADVTINEIRIESAGIGIRVSEAPGSPVGSLALHSNTIRNCSEWAISLCGDTSTDDLELSGDLSGTGNIIEGGIEALCPAWFEWPAGFLGSSDPDD